MYSISTASQSIKIQERLLIDSDTVIIDWYSSLKDYTNIMMYFFYCSTLFD